MGYYHTHPLDPRNEGEPTPEQEEMSTRQRLGLESPLGDSRENAVPCSRCQRRTWRLDAHCDPCAALFTGVTVEGRPCEPGREPFYRHDLSDDEWAS